MTATGLGQIVFYAVVLIALGVPLGAYIARVYEGDVPILRRAIGPVERALYRAAGVRPAGVFWAIILWTDSRRAASLASCDSYLSVPRSRSSSCRKSSAIARAVSLGRRA